MSGLVVTTPVFKMSFPNLFKPRYNELSKKEEFSVMALFEKGQDLTVLKNAAAAAAAKKWGTDQTKWPKQMRSPFREQSEQLKDGKLKDGMTDGALFLNLKSSNRPTIVDQNLQEIIDPSKLYAGCFVRASVGAYAYDNMGNRGISFGLNHIQLVKDGPPLSGRPSIESAFTPVAVEGGDGSANSIF